MSPQDDTEIMRRVYGAFVRKDLAAALDLQADDGEWSVAGPAGLIPWASPGPGLCISLYTNNTLGSHWQTRQFSPKPFVPSWSRRTRTRACERAAGADPDGAKHRGSAAL